MSANVKYPLKNHIYLVIILAVATVVTLSITILNYRNSVSAAADSLKFQALGIAVSLEASVRNLDLTMSDRGNVFKDIITEGKWEGIAFIALYDKNGVTVLHSNENLIGRRIEDKEIKAVADTGRPVYDYMTLGTGERVFVLNFPVHMHSSEKILRLSLHTYPVEKIVRQARLQMLSVFFVIGILWIMGYFFTKAVKRSEELKMAMAEKERLAVLGEMSSVLAHEIRNPLASIKGFAQFLKEQQGTEQRAKNTDYFDIIVSESERLERLTEDLLMYAKPVELRPWDFNLYELVEEVFRDLQTVNKEQSGIDLRHSIPIDMKIASDRDKLRQILMNIIQNSVDAIGDEGVIELSAERINDKITITIKDDGCGMDDEVRKKAFEPFFTTKARGTGLGLAVVDKLVRSLGGTMEIESELQKGTAFGIIIPANSI